MKRLPALSAFAVTLLQLGCVQAGSPPGRTGAQVCDPKSAECVSLPAKNAPLAPTVPPVPDSPLRIDCQKLPTQVERDTCSNRKQSTG